MSYQRIKAIILSNFFRMKHNLGDFIDAFYWPLMDVIIWGIMTVYFNKAGVGGAQGVVAFLLGGLILWTAVWRVQQDISVSFMWESWAENMANVFASPISFTEYIVALIILGMIKVVFSLALPTLVAYLLYSFNLFTLGLAIIPLMINLMYFAWVMGIMVTAFLLRFGHKVQSLAWSFIAIFQPFSCVFYPLETLPPTFQAIARLTPLTYVFESMRAILSGQPAPAGYYFKALLLNTLYLAITLVLFKLAFNKARELGRLAKLEE